MTPTPLLPGPTSRNSPHWPWWSRAQEGPALGTSWPGPARLVLDSSFAFHKFTGLSQMAKPAKNGFNSLAFLSTEVFSKRRKTCAL